MDLVMNNTRDALAAASRGPTEEITAGKVPLPQNISLWPHTSSDAQQSYALLEAASSIASLQTTIFNEDFRVGRGQAEHYDITDTAEAPLAFADMASAGLRAMEGPLSLFYTCVVSQEHIFNQSMHRSEIHRAFLDEIFGEFNLTESALGQLDGILTAFMAAVKIVAFEVQQGGTVDYTFRINHVVCREVYGDDGKRVLVYQPRTRIVYLKIDFSTYRWATCKEPETGTLLMSYTTHDFDLNIQRFLASKARFDVVFQGLLGEDTASYARRVNHVLVAE